ncbi:MAG: cation:proton antiporter, partial [archaeon]
MLTGNVFIELALILLIALGVSTVMRLIKQPLIIGYIITGILVSPFFLNIVRTTDTLTTFAQIGVALLLFIVGLNLNPKVIKEFGFV